MVRAIALPLAIGVSFLVLPALVCAAEEYIDVVGDEEGWNSDVD
jgi:hypothetical protein